MNHIVSNNFELALTFIMNSEESSVSLNEINLGKPGIQINRTKNQNQHLCGEMKLITFNIIATVPKLLQNCNLLIKRLLELL